jgi:hypothetical protein
MKRLTTCLALLIFASLAATAAAKEVVAAKVCGASDCRDVKDRDALAGLAEGGMPTDPPAAAPYYRMTLTIQGDGELVRWAVVVVPSEGVMRGGTEAEGYTWMPMPRQSIRTIRRVTEGLDPAPAAKLGGLDVKPPGAQVDQVVVIGDEPEGSGGDGAPLWPWLVFGSVGLGLVALAVVRFRRRPRPGPAQPAEG